MVLYYKGCAAGLLKLQGWCAVDATLRCKLTWWSGVLVSLWWNVGLPRNVSVQVPRGFR